MPQNTDLSRAWDIIEDSLEGFDSFHLTPVLESKYSDLALAVHPIERRGARVGTLLLFGRLSGAANGARLVNDLGLFPPLLPGQLEALYRYAGIFADSLAYMIEVATLASMQIQSAATGRGDAEHERRIREVFIEINEAAGNAGNVQEAFRQIAKRIGPALQLAKNGASPRLERNAGRFRFSTSGTTIR
ncbi:MAG: hypothetical protein MZU97_13260 [Bacillus subtilis]|nr:hypothetical protein [Bacillus subtilis]